MTRVPLGSDAVLAKRMIRRIAQAGPMTLAEYMAMALTATDDGYYMTGDPFGAHGDFVTAPEISQMFGELIGLWCADRWQAMGSPSEIMLVELGPGRGTLMADALRAARLLPDFQAAIRLHLVEISPTLRDIQACTLADAGLSTASVWHDRLSNLPEGPLLLVANEFFDALPVRQFVKRSEEWCENRVTATPDGTGLALCVVPQSRILSSVVPPTLRNAPEGAIFEISSAAVALMTEIAIRVTGHGGAALVIDYGYAEPPLTPTLQALRRHRPADLLEAPGHCDLTAHVDFGALAAAARRGSAATYGPIEQGTFLERLGIGERARTLSAGASAAQAEAIAAALARLTGSDQMGTLFKAFAVLPSKAGTPAGFQTGPGH